MASPWLLLLISGCSAEAGDFPLETTGVATEGLAIAQDPLATGVSLSASDRAGSFSCATLGCAGFAPTTDRTAERKGRGSNSQLALERNMYLGDINGDLKTDLVQHDDHRVFVSQANFQYTEISHLVLPHQIERLIVGDFIGTGWDQVCALSSAGVHCFGIDATEDQEELRLWFRQAGTPISTAEDVIVGNFDADAADELFIYDKSSGAFRMLEFRTVAGVPQFAAKTAYTPGNLAGRLTANMQLRAGDWNGDGRSDLIAVNANRQVLAFAAVTSGANDTFWWHFTSAGNTVGADEEYFLARVNADAKDDLVLRDQITGAIRFKKVEFNGGNPPLLSTDTGQLHVVPDGQLRPSYGHTGAPARDDMFLLKRSGSKHLYSYGAATSAGGADTYWWGWNRLAPNNHFGWAETTVKKTLFVPCKFSDVAAEPVSDARLAALPNRIRDYFWETTMGRVDIDYDRTDWAQLSFPVTSSEARSRSTIGRECAIAAGKDPADYDIVVAIKNSESGDEWFSGRYAVMPPSKFDVFFTVHEMGHVLGLDHTKNDIPDWHDGSYGNPWDPMSAGLGFVYRNPWNTREGPNFTSGSLQLLGAGAGQRVKALDLGYAKQKVWLSAVNRPATGEYTELRVPHTGNTGSWLSVEYREPSGFDRAIPRETVLIHYSKVGEDGNREAPWLRSSQDGVYDPSNGNSGTAWPHSERQPGESYAHERYGTIKVLRFVKHMAEVEITPPS